MTQSRLGVPLLPSWLRWGGVAVVAAGIFYLSVLAAPPETAVVPGRPDLLPLDKWRHFLAYAAFGGALAYATVDWTWRTRTMAAAVLAVVVVYGVGIEVWQSFVPDRYFGLGDAYANAFGGVLVLPLLFIRDRVPFVSIGELLGSVRQ